MELLPNSQAPSRTLSYEDTANLSHAIASPLLRHSASMTMFPTDPRPTELSVNKGEAKAVMSGILKKNGVEKYCMLLGCYLNYGDVMKRSGSTTSLSAMEAGSGKQKQLCLSDVALNFEHETCTIRLTKLKGNEAKVPKMGQEKVFVAKNETDYYLWQAALTRAAALWPGLNAPETREGRSPVNADTSPLGCMLRGMLRMWTFITIASNVDGVTVKDVNAGLHCLHTSTGASAHHSAAHASSHREDPRQAGRHHEHPLQKVMFIGQELRSTARISKEAFNSVLVNTLVQLPRLLPQVFEGFLVLLQEQRSRGSDASPPKALVDEVSPKLRRVGERFVSITLEYSCDVATGLWPADFDAAPSASGARTSASLTTFDCVELFRAWMSRAPTAPWSAVLVLTQRCIVPGVRESLGLRAPPRSAPMLPGLNGIRNVGNTCYLNSVLQCMMHNPHLVRLFVLRAQRLYVGNDGAHRCLSTMLGDLFHSMYTTSGALDASDVAGFLVDCDPVAFKRGDQHDAHEALVTILDILDSELCERTSATTDPTPSSSPASSERRSRRRVGQRSRASGALAPPPEVLPDYTTETLSEDALVTYWRAAYVRAHNSIVTHYFSGQTVQKVMCPSCGVASFCCDSFTYLIAPITVPHSGTKGKNQVTLEQCLEEAFKAETLEMGSKNKCDKCNEVVPEMQRTLELQRLPPYLLICLNRFEVDDHGRLSAKRDVPVLVPEQLSLGLWMRQAAVLPILGEGGNIHISQMDQTAKRRGSYELYGAVLHSGSISSGHYKAACRVGASWYEYSDTTVNRLSSYGVWSEDSAKEMYVLFYRSTAGDPEETAKR